VKAVKKSAVLLLSLALLFTAFHLFKKEQINPEIAFVNKVEREKKTLVDLDINLVDPNQAPHSIKAYALKGYEIMIDTQKYAKEYVGNKLNCTNCHFAAGDTHGGIQGGIALAGVAAKYPLFNPSLNQIIDLKARINNCFEKSLNGKALPENSEEMMSLLIYLQWISKDVPIYSEIPWLGLKPLKKEYKGSIKAGKKLYFTYCSLCHGENGEGSEKTGLGEGIVKDIPPLWGDDSFNAKAGMNHKRMLATFIYWNMPYMDLTPVLTEEQAFDVAAFILSHKRPE